MFSYSNEKKKTFLRLVLGPTSEAVVLNASILSKRIKRLYSPGI